MWCRSGGAFYLKTTGPLNREMYFHLNVRTCHQYSGDSNSKSQTFITLSEDTCTKDRVQPWAIVVYNQYTDFFQNSNLKV